MGETAVNIEGVKGSCTPVLVEVPKFQAYFSTKAT
jgi:hypothetical protein